MVPCATNKTLGGNTVCLNDTRLCPITDIVILEQNSTSDKLSDYRYETQLSSGTRPLYLAFTRTTNSYSNAPIQKIVLTNGRPCAFTDQLPKLPDGGIRPLYPLEALTDVPACQNYYK